MNVAVTSTIAAELPDLEKLIDEAEDQIGQAIRAVAALQLRGVQAMERAGIKAGLVGQVLGYAGRANAGVSGAAEAMQGVRASVHEATKRLAPTSPTPESGGGKEPPPKP